MRVPGPRETIRGGHRIYGFSGSRGMVCTSRWTHRTQCGTDDGNFLTIAVQSEVCGTELRLYQANPRTLPHFQWWDQWQGRWRDSEADARMEERTEERTDTAIAMLHRVLPDDVGSAIQERIAERWRAEGPPVDVIDRLLDVQLAPREWRSLLDIPLDDQAD